MFLQFLNSFLKAIRFACIRVASSSAQMTGATRDSLFFFNFLSKTIRLSLSCCFLKMPKWLIAGSEQERRGRDPVGHPQCAINELRDQAYEPEHEEVLQH